MATFPQSFAGRGQVLWLGLVMVLLSGCGGDSSDADAGLPATPAQAATSLENNFRNAPAPVRASADAAAQALREGDYERAVASLQNVKAAPNVTLDQGMAVHGTMVSLESRLIAAIEAGDPKAKRAYELLKRMKRN